MAKNANIIVGPIDGDSAKNVNVCDINAAKSQCVKLPRDIPAARTELGKTSEMNTQMTAPCPTACAAIKRNTNHVMPACVSPEKENAINDKETIYPMEPIYINVLLPSRSIRYQPTRVKIKLTIPMPTLERNALLFSKPAILNTRGAK